MKFIRRVIDEIFKASKDENKLLVGATSDIEDIEKFAVVRGALKTSHSIRHVVSTLAKMQQTAKQMGGIDPIF